MGRGARQSDVLLVSMHTTVQKPVKSQRRHWKKHKPNCIPPDSSLHELFDACAVDLWPSAPAALDYGFVNVELYHVGGTGGREPGRIGGGRGTGGGREKGGKWEI